MKLQQLRQYLDSRITSEEIWLTLSHVPDSLIHGTGPAFESEMQTLTKVDAFVLAEYVTHKAARTILNGSFANEDPYWTLRMEMETIVAALVRLEFQSIKFLQWHRDARLIVIKSFLEFLDYYRGIHD